MTPGGRLALSIAWGTAALAASFGVWLLAALAFVAGLAVVEEDRSHG